MMLPFGFCFVFATAAAFLTLPEEACLEDAGGGLVDLFLVAAMVEGFDGGGTEGGTASVKGVFDEVAPGDGGRPTSGCFKKSRGLRNMKMTLVYSASDRSSLSSGSTRHYRDERERRVHSTRKRVTSRNNLCQDYQFSFSCFLFRMRLADGKKQRTIYRSF
jgi:hypothetical protein